MLYSFDVALSTHDLLRKGECEPYWTHIVLESDDEADAHLLAAQFAHTIYGDMIVTRVLWRI